MRLRIRTALLVLLVVSAVTLARRDLVAQASPQPGLVGGADSIPESAIPEAARIRPGVPFDPAAATAAYIATLPAGMRARSDAYFEGGYWIQVWGFVLTVVIMLLL